MSSIFLLKRKIVIFEIKTIFLNLGKNHVYHFSKVIDELLKI